MNFYEIINIECKKNGLTVTELLRQIKMSSGNTGSWKNGGHPGIDKLIEISNILNVSIDYLLGREIKKDSRVLNYGESTTKYKIKELVDTILEQNNNEEELNALKIVLEKFIK